LRKENFRHFLPLISPRGRRAAWIIIDVSTTSFFLILRRIQGVTTNCGGWQSAHATFFGRVCPTDILLFLILFSVNVTVEE